MNIMKWLADNLGIGLWALVAVGLIILVRNWWRGRKK
jgi:hypothetical protein